MASGPDSAGTYNGVNPTGASGVQIWFKVIFIKGLQGLFHPAFFSSFIAVGRLALNPYMTTKNQHFIKVLTGSKLSQMFRSVCHVNQNLISKQ